jgi:hypothetical protein
MFNNNVKLWEKFIEKYKELFLTIDEIWILKLEEVNRYILENNKLPSSENTNKTIASLRNWIFTQEKNYRENAFIIKNNDNIKKIWEDFVNKNNILFGTSEQKWFRRFNKLKDFVINNNRYPNEHINCNDKYEIKLGYFVNANQENSKNNTQIMKNNNIKKLWDDFISEYDEKFKQDKKNIWKNNLKKLENFIEINKRVPSIKINEDDCEKKLAEWFSTQKRIFKKINNKLIKESILIDYEISILWNDFLEKYNVYFLSFEEEWYIMYEKVKNYIILNKKFPQQHHKDKEIFKLGSWLSNYKTKYKNRKGLMINEDIRLKFEELINMI